MEGPHSYAGLDIVPAACSRLPLVSKLNRFTVFKPGFGPNFGLKGLLRPKKMQPGRLSGFFLFRELLGTSQLPSPKMAFNQRRLSRELLKTGVIRYRPLQETITQITPI